MIRRFHVPFVFAGALMLGACSAQSGPTDSTPAPGESAAPLSADPGPAPKMAANPAPERGPHARRGPHGPGLGPMGPLIDSALLDLDLPDAKANGVRELRRDLIKNGGTVHEASHEIDKKLADGLRAGQIDAASIQAEITQIQKNAAESVNQQISALDKLHSILDAKERHALVEAVRAHAPPDPMQGRMPGHMRGPKRPPSAPAPLFEGLDLTDTQLKALETALGPKPDLSEVRPRFEQHRAEMQKVLDAFEKDDFVASSVIPAGEFSKHATEHLERNLALAKAALSVLTLDQRALLADRLERKGPPPPPMPPL